MEIFSSGDSISLLFFIFTFLLSKRRFLPSRDSTSILLFVADRFFLIAFFYQTNFKYLLCAYCTVFQLLIFQLFCRHFHYCAEVSFVLCIFSFDALLDINLLHQALMTSGMNSFPSFYLYYICKAQNHKEVKIIFLYVCFFSFYLLLMDMSFFSNLLFTTYSNPNKLTKAVKMYMLIC